MYARSPAGSAKTISFDTSPGPGNGLPIDGGYVERFWLPHLGPTALVLARFALRNHGQTWGIEDVADSLGVKAKTVMHAARRLAGHSMARIDGGPDAFVLTVTVLVRPVKDRADQPAPSGCHQAVIA